MLTGLAQVTLVVSDYDQALQWFTQKLGLEVRRNDAMFGAEGFRFVTVGVKGQDDVEIVLHKPFDAPSSGTARRDSGGPRGGVHSLLFYTDDCRKEAEGLKERGVKVLQGPEDVPWGVQAVIEDLYGNSHVLVEPNALALQGREPAKRSSWSRGAARR